MAEDAATIEGLAAAYPGIDLLGEAVKWRTWLGARKTKPKNLQLSFTRWVQGESEKRKREAEEAAASTGPEFPMLTAPPSGRAKIDLSEPDHLTELAGPEQPVGKVNLL